MQVKKTDSSEIMRLEGKGISFRYGKKSRWILRDVNIDISRGEVVGLMGPSGLGKSTLSRILAGYLEPINGRVLCDGRSLPRTGYYPVQLIYQHPEKAVNPRWHMDKILREGWNPDDHILQLFGIDRKWFSRWPGELSGGELQRFCIVRALAPQTCFIIADEISTMLDAITQAQIWEIMIQVVKTRNIGILVVSHNEKLLGRLCTRVLDFQDINSCTG